MKSTAFAEKIILRKPAKHANRPLQSNTAEFGNLLETITAQ